MAGTPDFGGSERYFGCVGAIRRDARPATLTVLSIAIGRGVAR